MGISITILDEYDQKVRVELTAIVIPVKPQYCFSCSYDHTTKTNSTTVTKLFNFTGGDNTSVDICLNCLREHYPQIIPALKYEGWL